MKINRLHLILIWLCIIIALVMSALALIQKETNQAVIQLPQLYASFDMTKELEKRFQASNKELLTQSDSLNVKIETLSRKLSDQSTYTKEGELLLMQMSNMKAQIDQKVQGSKLQIESQIWNRLNVYLLEYVEANPHAIILGAKGVGDILHVDPSIDITTEVTDFVNDKYHGS